MKLGNKGFLLFDSLVGFLLLVSFICFFTSFMSVLIMQKSFYEVEIEATTKFRNSIYNYYKNSEYIIYDEEKIHSEINGDEYCIYYKGLDEEKSICN